jgi:hypothetical protein
MIILLLAVLFYFKIRQTTVEFSCIVFRYVPYIAST